MRLIVFVLFWVGMFTAVREWLHARKHGLPITRAEKLYPTIAFVLVMAAQPVMYQVGISPEASTLVLAFSIAGILNVWAMQRKVRRPTRANQSSRPAHR